MTNEKQRPIYTMDLETDPFKHGRFPQPFCGDVYDGREHRTFWHDDPKTLILQMREYVEGLEPGIIYMHNGGRFDIFYMMDWIVDESSPVLSTSNMMIVNGRILKAIMKCHTGNHEIRDSYAILPFRLAAYKKDDIDYKLLEKNVRDLHREEIVSYLRGDTEYLFELCRDFVAEFGEKLTIGSTAMGELRKIHAFDCLTERQDKEIRSLYYYGGRVQCFQKGVIRGKFQVIDVNSMYPFVMRNFKHPISGPGWESDKVSKFTGFVSVEGKNHGAFPRREKNGIRFDCEDGIFHVSIHEYKTAIRYGLFEPKRIIKCVDFDTKDSFKEFVDYFYNARIKAKIANDSSRSLFYKFILNSAYGKFAQNPENYSEYQITSSDKIALGWEPAYFPNDQYIIWKKAAKDYKRFNVATAASITGAARSVLLEAIANAKNPLYCDTDSLICESVENIKMHDSDLGAWKIESTANCAAIAGKKLYAIFQGSKCVKQASKGVNLSAVQILRVAKGEEIETHRDAPSFKVGVNAQGKLTPDDVQHSFISRKVRMT